jgi:DNA-binding response OmpR family regulator
MKTLLILAQHPDFVEGIQAGLSPENYRVVHRLNLEDAEPLLRHGLLNACILDVEGSAVRGMWMIEKLRRLVPNCPIIIYTGTEQWDWEEEAYLKGVAHVLAKPVRSRLLETLLERMFDKISSPVGRTAISAAPISTFAPMRAADGGSGGAPVPANSIQAFEVLRHFSAILTHSLDAEALLKKFLLLLREIVGVNRAAVFLREPGVTFAGGRAGDEGRLLRKGCAIGLPSGLHQHFELSFEGGIGAHLFRSGRILRRHSDEVRADTQMQQEFELLGAQVAVPILDRETLIGVAVFNSVLPVDSAWMFCSVGSMFTISNTWPTRMPNTCGW